MCGICGVIGEAGTQNLVPNDVISRMLKAIAHRGPDDEGTYVENNIALGHRRLSIIDLSKNGHQPMFSADGRLAIVYNGELYNFKTLKLELQRAFAGNNKDMAYPFRTQSDTEVILAAYLRWGADCLKHFNGMFAFAIWDKEKKELFIARDRLGIKPLYFWFNDKIFVFASELRALLQSGLVPKKLSSAALNDYVTNQTVHAPQTIIENVSILQPGHYMLIKENEPATMQQKKYWSLTDIPLQPENRPYPEICKDVQNLLFDAVEMRLVADVPFGAFLSGGIDSSIVVAMMSKLMTQKVKTFSVNFKEITFDESPYASEIAKQYNTEHHPILLSLKLFLDKLPEAMSAMDHPSGDGMNSYVVSEATKKEGITMALSGLGGDELFAGYPLFRRLYKLEKMKWVTGFPKPLISLPVHLYKLLNNTPAANKLLELFNLPDWNLENTYPLTRKTLSPDEVSQLLTSQKGFKTEYHFNPKHGILSKISSAELSNYLPDILLRDTDQMSMAHALEVRVPFLDYKLVEYVSGLSDKVKYPHTPKKLLTDSTRGLLPENIINRPKMGFTFPWAEWMKSELKTFCEGNMIGLSDRPQFNKDNVQSLWQGFLHDSAKTPWYKIWHLVVLENWLKENGIDG
ncbi:MAG: asparagine synthase (glutamine-hydrolyzing) [Bacteroidia bacterium]